MFSNTQPLFLQKTKPMYPVPKYLGFEFGPQRIKNLVVSPLTRFFSLVSVPVPKLEILFWFSIPKLNFGGTLVRCEISAVSYVIGNWNLTSYCATL